MKKKFSFRNNDVSCTYARGMLPFDNFLLMCNLMRLGEYFDAILYRTIRYLLVGFQGIFPMNTHEI